MRLVSSNIYVVLSILSTILILGLIGSVIIVSITQTQKANYNDECKIIPCNSYFNLKCVENKCSCFSYEYYNNSSCLPKNDFNQSCNSIDQCRDDKYLICSNNVCLCNENYYWDNLKCITKIV